MSKRNNRSPRRPSPFDNKASRSFTARKHTPTTGFANLPKLVEGKVEKLLHGVELKNLSKTCYTTTSESPGAVEARKRLADALAKFESINQKGTTP